MTYPRKINLGSGKDFRDEYLNIDIQDDWRPDIVADLSQKDFFQTPRIFQTERFGEVVLSENSIDELIAIDVLEHIHDLVDVMTNALALLREEGVFNILVPYDLSYGAWQDPTHVRAFNEKSWLYYTDWSWYLGWATHRFTVDNFEMLLNPIGQELHSRGIDQQEIMRTPRAVDSMKVSLRKIALRPEEKQFLAAITARKKRNV